MRRWEELRPELDAREVRIVTISTDTPGQIARQRKSHGAQAVMLSDPQLVVTDQFNLRNPKNLAPGGIRGLPIPTTILVDASGTVRWIDQSKDYQTRSDPDRVLAVLQEALPA